MQNQISVIYEKEQLDQYISAQCGYNGTPAGITPKKCMEAINEYCFQHKWIARCYKVSFKTDEKNNENSLASKDEVKKMIEDLKKTQDKRYFNIPKIYKLDNFQVFDSQRIVQNNDKESQSNNNQHQMINLDDLLEKFVAISDDELKDQQQRALFNDIDIFCQDLLQNQIPNDEDPELINQSNQNKTKYVFLFGMRKDIELLHNKKIELLQPKFSNKKPPFFYLQTRIEDKKDNDMNSGKIKIDTQNHENGKKIFQKKLTPMKIKEVNLGVINPVIEYQNKVREFYSLYQLNYDVTKTLQDIDIFFTNEEDQNVKILIIISNFKRQSISIQMVFNKYYLKIEFPYLYCKQIISEAQRKYYFELVVPPRYFIRPNIRDSTENLDPKKNPWIRITNFYSLGISNELLRIEYTNNTVISIEFDKDDFGQKLDYFTNMLKTQFSMVLDKDKLIENNYDESKCLTQIFDKSKSINFKDRNQFTQYENRFDMLHKKLNQEYQFNLSYSILTLISHNKVIII